MPRFDGSLALKLDFGELTTTTFPSRTGLRLADTPSRLTGPDKYHVLEHRRRQAQIKARRLLELGDRETDHA
jgi:hypothetical protein